eukprot:scaffold5134_cov38-Prasinocladus_malaysianus.AAC.2
MRHRYLLPVAAYVMQSVHADEVHNPNGRSSEAGPGYGGEEVVPALEAQEVAAGLAVDAACQAGESAENRHRNAQRHIGPAVKNFVPLTVSWGRTPSGRRWIGLNRGHERSIFLPGNGNVAVHTPSTFVGEPRANTESGGERPEKISSGRVPGFAIIATVTQPPVGTKHQEHLFMHTGQLRHIFIIE